MATRELTLEEKLHRFVERWKNYHSTEQQGAQLFLNHLLECYGVFNPDPGTIFEQHPVKPLEKANGELFGDAPRRKGKAAQIAVSAERMDMYIPKVVVWEMKGPEQTDLARHYQQLLGYWARTRPRYMVLCNFHEFWIYDTDQEQGQLNPVFRFKLTELPGHAAALQFLSGEEAHFAQRSANVTREAAEYVGSVLQELLRQSDNPQANRPRYSKFTLECVFAMFAEDSHILPTKPFTRAMKAAQASGDMSPVYNLFDDLGRESDDDRSTAVPYINGPLFDRKHPKFPVAKDLIATLYTAADKYDWAAVRPEVFGSIFERSLLSSERAAAGAHFTGETDIMKVVGPTVVRPWREWIGTCKFRKDAEVLIERMRHYHILDPACGSGNFLYIAYREMKRLEAALRAKHFELWQHKEQKRASDKYPAPSPGPWFSIYQLHGIDKLTEAVQLTRVVLWIGEHLANEELSLGESTLPLSSLEENIIEADALFTPWFRPPEDGISELAIIGNPPFMGRHKMRLTLGDEYVDRLHAAYPDNRNADLVSYWYPQALSTLRPGERAGFVSSNSIAQNESREASLDRIVAAGGAIHDAWKSYPWPGEAAVHVSIVNWIMGKYEGLVRLDDNVVTSISSQLSSTSDSTMLNTISKNQNLSFQGALPANIEFVIDDVTRNRLIHADPNSESVIRPYLIGRDLNSDPSQSAGRYIIDFADMSMEEARSYKSAFRYLQEFLYPTKMAGNKSEYEKKRWWQFKRPALEMRKAIAELDRFLVISRVTHLVLFSFADHSVLTDNKLMVIALDSYYHYGILSSNLHEIWAWAFGSTLKSDLAYTNTTIFETFPFPLLPGEKYDPRVVPETKQAKQVAKVAEKLYTKRQTACIALNLGLTKLYNYIKGKTPLTGLSVDHQKVVAELQTLHSELNDAVNACYDWPPETWRDDNEVLTRLLELNKLLTQQA